jgi:alkanesulfonate monooxygenase SsuD/methylene tetrahydromethanopterin reductase-like flavin-dependent oxidoreductase (luciferase family)
MAIEFGTLHNGASDLPAVLTPDDVVVAKGTLEEVNASFQRSTINQIRQAVLCEKVGFNYFFMTEHHFQPEGAENSPAPILAETAVAALTKRIRLGQAANILPWWQPTRLAEMAAMLDVISGGRVEFGIGRGYQPRETEIIGHQLGSSQQDQERNRAYFDECFQAIIKCWTEPSFQFKGDYIQLPPKHAAWDHPMTQAYFKQPGVGRSLDQVLDFDNGSTTLKEMQVFPRPIQQPHPQVWMPLTSERSIRWAARNGVNGYTVVDSPSRLKRNIEIYMEEAEKHDWPDRANRGPFKYGWDAEKHRGFITGRWVLVTNSKNHKEMVRRADAAARLQWDYYTPFRGFTQAITEIGETPYGDGVRPTGEELRERGIIIVGSAEEIAERVLSFREAGGYDDMMFNSYFDFGGFSGPELEEQVQLYAEQVMPILARECGGRVEFPETNVQLVPELRESLAETIGSV